MFTENKSYLDQINRRGTDAFPVSAHLPPSFPRLPLHGLVYHELHSRVDYQDEGGECAVPQSSHTLVAYDLREGI